MLRAASLLLLTGCLNFGANLRGPLRCDPAFPDTCEAYAQQRLEAGDAEGAEQAWAAACNRGYRHSCLMLGRRKLEQGELDAAEPLLVAAHPEEDAEAAFALSELHERRGTEADNQVADELRAQANALDKPTVEVITQLRFAPVGGLGGTLAINVQPMEFWSRRFTLGLMLASGAGGGTSLDGFVGGQYFFNDIIGAYARVLAGTTFDTSARGPFDLGGEVGLKVCWGAIGHFEVSTGVSLAAPPHLGVGIGLDGLLALLLFLH